MGELFGQFVAARSIAYFVLLTLGLGGLWWYLKKLEKLHRAEEASSQPNVMHFGPQVPRKLHRKVYRLLYGTLAGCIGAQSILFAKAVALLLREESFYMFAFWQTYFMVFFLAITVYLQVKWLNDGLQRFDALYMAPIFQAFWIFFSVVSGLIVFQEYRGMKTTGIFMFALGIVLTILGVYSLSQRKGSETADADIPVVDRVMSSSIPFSESPERAAARMGTIQELEMEHDNLDLADSEVMEIDLAANKNKGSVKTNGIHSPSSGYQRFE